MNTALFSVFTDTILLDIENDIYRDLIMFKKYFLILILHIFY